MTSMAAGTFFSVEGVVDFRPVAGRNYLVKGELKKDGSPIWIEDEASGEIVTVKVERKN